MVSWPCSWGDIMKKFILAAGILLGLAFSAQAATVLALSGTTSTSSPAHDSVNSPGLSGVGFSLGNDLTNLSFTVAYTCAGSCLVDAYLMNSIGPSATNSNVVAAAVLDGSNTTAFSGINLTAGDYALILTTNTGIFSWNASSSPNIFYGGTAAPFNNFVDLAYNSVLPYASTVSALTDLAFLYTIEQFTDPIAAVPLGPTAPFLALGIVGLAALRRRAKT